MSRIRIAVALALSALVAVAAITLAADGDESTPPGGSDAAVRPSPNPRRSVAARRRSLATSSLGGGSGPWSRAHSLCCLGSELGGPGFFRPDAVIKALAVVDAGARVTLAVPEAERRAPLPPLRLRAAQDRAATFGSPTAPRRCALSLVRRSGRYPGRQTQFNGGFFVRGAHCAAIEVWAEGRTDPRRRWLPFGIEDRSCGADPRRGAPD